MTTWAGRVRTAKLVLWEIVELSDPQTRVEVGWVAKIAQGACEKNCVSLASIRTGVALQRS